MPRNLIRDHAWHVALPVTETLFWPVALIVGAAFALATRRAQFLTFSGAVAGGLFASSLLALGGLAWAAPSFTFFLLSSLLSKVRSRRKVQAEAGYEKGNVRDAGQVLANGGVGWAMLLVYAVMPSPVFYWGFLGAFAAATADTWATEIGSLAPGRPRLITTGRSVAMGTSGAVSLYGLLGAFAGGMVVWLAAFPFAGGIAGMLAGWKGVVVIIASGLLGSVVDSLLGATVQAQYLDSRTGAVTERPTSEGKDNVLIRRWRWVGNDVVNLAGTLVGALAAMGSFWIACGLCVIR